MMKDIDDDELALYSAPGDGSCEHLITARMAAEIRRHRSAVAASKERVREAVLRAVLNNEGYVHHGTMKWREADRIATRAAEQLAGAGAGLSIPERVEADALLEHLVEQRTEATNDGRSGDAEAFNDWHTVLVKLLGATK